jgi:hypothetical protein
MEEVVKRWPKVELEAIEKSTEPTVKIRLM